MKLLYTLGANERFKYGDYRALALLVPPKPEYRNERYRYRILFFKGLASSPSIAINMESDLIGTWLFTIQEGQKRQVLDSFDNLPEYSEFRQLALAEMDKRLAVEQDSKT